MIMFTIARSPGAVGFYQILKFSPYHVTTDSESIIPAFGAEGICLGLVKIQSVLLCCQPTMAPE